MKKNPIFPVLASLMLFCSCEHKKMFLVKHVELRFDGNMRVTMTAMDATSTHKIGDTINVVGSPYSRTTLTYDVIVNTLEN